MTHFIIGVDLGGTNLRCAIVDRQGKPVHRLKQPTQAYRGASHILKLLLSTLEKLISSASVEGKDILAIGIGSPGHIDYNSGIVISATPNLPGWTGTPLKEVVEQKFNLPTYIDNDGNVAALGEKWFGAGKKVNSLILLTIGTGIGGGIIINGKIYHGAFFGAGELGHVTVDQDGKACNCGSYGCIEAYAAAPAIEEKARKAVAAGISSQIKELVQGDLNRITTQIIAQAAKADDELAMHLLEEAGRYIGMGLVSVINIIDPEMIAIGGGVAKAGELLLKPIIWEVWTRLPGELVGRVKVVLAKLGDDAGTIGAAALAMQNLGMI